MLSSSADSPHFSSSTTAASFPSVSKPLWSASDEQRAWELVELFEEELSPLSAKPHEAYDWIFRKCGSHERMNAVMHLQNEMALGEMAFSDWLVLLGRVWSVCDNIGLYKSDLVEVLMEWHENPLTTIPELMTRKERAAFETLPEQVTIYRGCGPRNREGLSWSLCREVASRFPFYSRYWTDRPTLLTAMVPKHRIAALRLDRNEQEAIVVDLPSSCWTEERITEPPPARSAAHKHCTHG